MNTEKPSYNLGADRRQCERLITAFSLRYPELHERIPTERIKNKSLRTICSQIKAIYKQEGSVSPEILLAHAVPRLTTDTFTEENCRNAISELMGQSKEVSDESALPRLTEHLQELETRDAILNISSAMTERVNYGEDIKKICAMGNQLVELAGRLKGIKKSVSVGDAFESLFHRLLEARAINADVGIPYPIECMAKALGTLYPSDLVVIAARPAVGKTALGLNFCRFTDDAMGFISSEMAKEQLAMRFIAMDSGIPANRIRDAKNLTESEMEIASECWTRHKGRKLYIEDKGGIDIGEIEDAAEVWVSLHGIKVLIVDYAQRINSDRKHNSEAEKIGHVTKRLKELAKRLDICVVLLAQINRDAVKGDRRPQLHDIKGSGDIEQEADVIILMHKPSMGTSKANERCVVEMIIDKNRHGRVGIVLTEYEAERVTFFDAAESVVEKYKNADD